MSADPAVASAAPPETGRVPRRQNRVTRRSVLIIDRLADWSITVGGLLVIVAVFGIMLFLAQVTVPLFTGALRSNPSAATRSGPTGGER